MKKITLGILVLAIIVISGCVQEEQKTVVVDGVEYELYHDVNSALLVDVVEPGDVKRVATRSRSVDIIFDCAAQEDEPVLTVSTLNAVTVLQSYLVYSKNTFANFNTYCFIGDTWYNSTDSEVERPALNGTVLWIKGPNTGAAATSVFAEENTVVIQGTSVRNLTLATDAFSLTVLGIKK